MLQAVEVYEKLRTKIGEEEAALLVQFVEEAVEKRAATKEDVLEVRHALEQGNLGLKQEIAEVAHHLEEVNLGLKQEIAEVKAGLERRITEVEHRLERRMDRTFYILLAALLILNGDKVLGFLNSLLTLFR